MSDRLTKEDVDLLTDPENEEAALDLMREFRSDRRQWRYWRQVRKVRAGTRPPQDEGG